jgi:hypothetical protein
MTSRKRPSAAFWLTVALVVVLVGLATAIAMRSGWQSYVIADVSRASDISLSAPSEKVSGVSVWVTGQIDGKAEIWAASWDRQIVSGQVNCRAYHDWFDRDCQLHYEPLGVHSGTLTVRYQFH